MGLFSRDNVGRGERNPQTPAPVHPAAAGGSPAESREAGTPGGFGRLSGAFSLVELMASVTVFLVISTTIFTLLFYYQKSYGTTRLKADMYNNIRGVVELMAQEIGQAGLVTLPNPTLSDAVTSKGSAQTVAISSTACILPPQNAIVDTGSSQETVNITALGAGTITAIFSQNHASGTTVYVPPCLTQSVQPSASAQSPTVSSTTSMFVGENLIVDLGSAQEVVTLTGVNASASTITAIFSQAHSASGAVGAPINVQGVFPNGVMSSSAASQLQLFGDINADGGLYFVQYDCNTTTTPGTLTRSLTTVTPTVSTSSTPQTLLSNLIANPGGTACFQYTVTTAGSYSLNTNVALTLTVQTTALDPQTGVYLTLTKSFLNLAPRNVLTGVELINDGGFTNFIQPTPPNLPLTGG